MFTCAICNQLTTGAFTEGSCRWGICESCINELAKEPDPPGGYGICKDTGTLAQENIDGWE